MAVHPEYANLFDALTAANISHCLLRDELDGGELLDDLDLLVEENRFGDAIDVLQQIGYHVKTTHRALPYKSVLVKFWDGVFIVIDLHCRIVQEEIVILDSELVLQRRVFKDGYHLPAEEDLVAVLVLHNILGKKRIQKKHVPVIQALIGRTESVALKDRLRTLCPPGCSEIVLNVLHDVDAFQETSKDLLAIHSRLVRSYERSDPALKWRRLLHRARRFRRRWSLLPRAPIYALTGVDGVGKSSLNDALLKTLNQQGGFRSVTEYMGPWGHYRIKWMKGELFSPGWSVTTGQWLTGLISPRAKKGPGLILTKNVILKMVRGQALTETERAQHGLIRSQSRLFLTLRYFRSLYAAARFMIMITLEMYYRYFIVWSYRRRGTTVVTDRYIYDLMTGRMHDYIPNYRRARAFLCWIFPRPTQVFLLYNDPETILQRKDDLSADVLHRFIALYDEQAEQRGFVRIKTDRPPEVLAADIISEHLHEIAAKGRL